MLSKKKLLASLSLISLSIVLYACSFGSSVVSRDRGPRPGSIDVSGIPDAVPKNEPRSKYGNPPSYVVNGKRYYVMQSGRNFTEKGIASWYGEKFHGRRTSSGETYDMYAMTAAHKSLPLPSYVEVTNLENGRKIIVKVNDRGPFHENRIIDLSYTAASKLDILRNGTGWVEIRSIGVGYTTAQRKGAPVENPQISGNTSVRLDNNGFYIQVGSFSDLENAVKMRDKLGPIARNLISINEVSVNGVNVFRVRFGPLADVTLADKIVNSLGTYGVYEHYITVN
jgi:rare lipoprotein A